MSNTNDHAVRTDKLFWGWGDKICMPPLNFVKWSINSSAKEHCFGRGKVIGRKRPYYSHHIVAKSWLFPSTPQTLYTALYATKYSKQTTDTLVKRPSILLWQFMIMEFNCGKKRIILAECHLVHSNWESGTFLTKVLKLLLKSGSCYAQIRGEVWGFSIRNFKVFSICFFTLTGNYPERHIIVRKWQKPTKVFLRYVNCQWSARCNRKAFYSTIIYASSVCF